MPTASLAFGTRALGLMLSHRAVLDYPRATNSVIRLGRPLQSTLTPEIRPTHFSRFRSLSWRSSRQLSRWRSVCVFSDGSGARSVGFGAPRYLTYTEADKGPLMMRAS